jgi:hypothetical protein
MREKWLPIAGTDGRYEVSNMGQVRRVVAARGATAGRILAPQKTGKEKQYRKVVLGRKNPMQVTVHRLVAIAFLGSPPTPKHQVNHIDGDGSNNAVTNLEWVTRSENGEHSYRVLGRKAVVPLGTAQWNSKLDNKRVSEIRRLWATGLFTQDELAGRFAVLQTTISRVVLRQSWKHVA